MYVTLNTKIEQMSRVFGFLLSKLVIAGIAPPTLILTLVNLFVYDLGAESYYLPVPMLYVSIDLSWPT